MAKHKPRHSNTIRLTGHVGNHVVGQFLDKLGRQCACCTCGWHVHLVKWDSETPAQHERRRTHTVLDHFDKVQASEMGETIAVKVVGL